MCAEDVTGRRYSGWCEPLQLWFSSLALPEMELHRILLTAVFIPHLYHCFILPLNDRRCFFCAVDSLVANGCSRTPNSKKEAITSKYKWLNQPEEVKKQMHLFADSLARRCLTKFAFKLNFFSTMCFSSFYFSGWSCAFTTYMHVLFMFYGNHLSVSLAPSPKVCPSADKNQMDLWFRWKILSHKPGLISLD